MAAKENTQTQHIHTETTLGRETVFTGDIRFDTSLSITGKYKGNIESSGFLLIDEGAEVNADIKVCSVIVCGTVTGNIEASDRLEILSGAKVTGNLRTARLKIADGVLFEGKCEMISDSDGVDIFSASVSQLKKSLERV